MIEHGVNFQACDWSDDKNTRPSLYKVLFYDWTKQYQLNKAYLSGEAYYEVGRLVLLKLFCLIINNYPEIG